MFIKFDYNIIYIVLAIFLAITSLGFFYKSYTSNKDNHIKAAGGIEKALKIIKNNKPYMTDIEVEVDTIEQFLECQRLDVRYILLDNMSPQYISECIKNNKNGAVLEASGGINLSTVSDIAQTGVDFISVGRLTHSSPSLDLSLHIL